MFTSTYHVFVVLIGLAVTVCYGQVEFLCYACTYTSNPSKVGYECVTSPENYTEGPNQVPCFDEVCFTEKTTSLFTGEVDLMKRGCGFLVEGCEGDNYIETCSTVCTSQLCNNQNLEPKTTTHSSAGGSTTRDPNAFINCYNCQYDVSVDGGNDICVTNPEDVPNEPPDNPNTARCSAGSVCHIFRTHELGNHRVQLMDRSCSETNLEDGCTPNGVGGETCLTTCHTDFCNDGDGIIGGAETHRLNMWLLLCVFVGYIFY